ncbi:lytic murein transglycosylase B [Marinobacter sp. R17]|uniref:lytic murein transglycosylase B n=1 Tax=Marinobacter sp. R17 TaxID=2484250 RepID=UPI000F4C159E|nr:lytic murein transglycosylase B [Marinobacter sp. R17]ROT96261.1 lytic murein transglycosylase B [Marinobacter sp. R17]
MPSHIMSVVLGLWAMLVASLTHAGYVETPAGQAFVDEMVRQHGFDRSTLEIWLASAQRQSSILEAISHPAEHTLAWYEYRHIFIKPTRIEKGQAFLQTHADTFARAEQELGVSRYIVAAIIGVETQYGEYAGNYRVLDALTTLAFDYPPRSAFFRKQLGEFFLMAREQELDPTVLKGSYAGAMGFGQFIPSSYRDFAIDFDHDGRADIVNNPVDAIGSVANYFARHGWQAGAPVAEPVAGADYPQALFTDGLAPKLTVADYQAAGIVPKAGVSAETRARLMRLQAEEGQENWLTYPNFYVITRYNHSQLYAMAVLALSQALARNPDKARG